MSRTNLETRRLARKFATAIVECEAQGKYDAERTQWVRELQDVVGTYDAENKLVYRLPQGGTANLDDAVKAWAQAE